MNRFIYVLFLLPVLFLVSSCKDDDNNDKTLRVSSPSTIVPEYSVSLITVSGGTGRHYFFRIEDEEIVSAELDYGNRLYIHGLKVGETGIIIRDGIGDSIRVEVKVVENNFFLTVKEHHLIIDTEETDDIIYNEIEKELSESFPFPVGTIYKLRRNESLTEGDLTIYLPDENKTEIKGTFRQFYEEDEKIDYLVFNYNEQEIIYRMYYGNINSLKTLRKDMVIEHVNLWQDLTIEYREKYPQTSLKKVIRSQYCFMETIVKSQQ